MKIPLPPCQLAQMPEYRQSDRGTWALILVRFVAEGRDHLLQMAAFGPACNQLGSVPQGAWLNIEADMRGKEYNGKHFVNLVAQSVEVAQQAGLPPQPGAQYAQPGPPQEPQYQPQQPQQAPPPARPPSLPIDDQTPF
jgi:hypothetical protein